MLGLVAAGVVLGFVIGWLVKKGKVVKVPVIPEAEKLKQYIEELNRKIKSKKDEILRVEKEIAEQEKRIEALKELEKKQRENLEKLQGVVKNVAEEIKKGNDEIAAKSEELKSAEILLQTINKNIYDGRLFIESRKEEIEELKVDVEELRTIIWNLSVTNREMRVREKGGNNGLSWVLEVSERDKRLESVLEGLKIEYPELEGSFGGILWSKVWRPKVKEIVEKSGVDGKPVIYRISLVKDESIGYVGQTVGLLDRWYEHGRKLTGMNKSGEKFYNSGYSVGDFRWEILEIVEDKSLLNEKEKYWIEFYAAVEVGLNSKKGT